MGNELILTWKPNEWSKKAKNNTKTFQNQYHRSEQIALNSKFKWICGNSSQLIVIQMPFQLCWMPLAFINLIYTCFCFWALGSPIHIFRSSHICFFSSINFEYSYLLLCHVHCFNWNGRQRERAHKTICEKMYIKYSPKWLMNEYDEFSRWLDRSVELCQLRSDKF